MQFKKLKFQNFHKYIKYITTPFSGEKNSEKKKKNFFFKCISFSMNHQDICYFFFVHVISILSCYAGVVC